MSILCSENMLYMSSAYSEANMKYIVMADSEANMIEISILIEKE